MLNSFLPIFKTILQDGFIITTQNAGTIHDVDLIRGVDGNPTSIFRSGISPKMPSYYKINFPKSYYIAGYAIYHSTSYTMNTWEFQIYHNNSWITIHSGVRTTVGEITRIFIDNPYAATAARIKCTSRPGDNSWGFAELEIYSPETIVLLKHNNEYYSIDDIHYNTTSRKYNSLSQINFSQGFFLTDLFMTKTLGGETFKPIDKFDNFSIVLNDTDMNYSAKVRGIKSNKELIIQQFDIYTSLFDNIYQILTTVTELGTSYVKFVFSKDMGDTWATIVDGNVEYTDCIIPKKRYQDFTSEDIFYFNAAKNTIDEVGFSANTLSGFNWNSINPEKLRFAYVISTQNYSNNASLREISITYDENGYFQEMKDSECDIETFNHSIKIKSKISSPLIQTNIII